MLIRTRSNGAVITEREFKSMYSDTSFPAQLTVSLLNNFDADIVLNGAQPTPEFYQVVIQDNAEKIGNQWFTKFICVDMDEGARAAKDEKVKANNKAAAIKYLQQTDWTAIPSVSDPAISDPYLTNSNEFAVYRNELRKIAVNPPVVAVFPTIPVEIWSE
jgi:hypothetical protein